MMICLDKFYNGKLITIEGYNNYKNINKTRDTIIAQGIANNPLA